jgi:hypothetical protein
MEMEAITVGIIDTQHVGQLTMASLREQMVAELEDLPKDWRFLWKGVALSVIQEVSIDDGM